MLLFLFVMIVVIIIIIVVIAVIIQRAGCEGGGVALGGFLLLALPRFLLALLAMIFPCVEDRLEPRQNFLERRQAAGLALLAARTLRARGTLLALRACFAALARQSCPAARAYRADLPRRACRDDLAVRGVRVCPAGLPARAAFAVRYRLPRQYSQ